MTQMAKCSKCSKSSKSSKNSKSSNLSKRSNLSKSSKNSKCSKSSKSSKCSKSSKSSKCSKRSKSSKNSKCSKCSKNSKNSKCSKSSNLKKSSKSSDCSKSTKRLLRWWTFALEESWLMEGIDTLGENNWWHRESTASIVNKLTDDYEWGGMLYGAAGDQKRGSVWPKSIDHDTDSASVWVTCCARLHRCRSVFSLIERILSCGRP